MAEERVDSPFGTTNNDLDSESSHEDEYLQFAQEETADERARWARIHTIMHPAQVPQDHVDDRLQSARDGAIAAVMQESNRTADLSRGLTDELPLRQQPVDDEARRDAQQQNRLRDTEMTTLDYIRRGGLGQPDHVRWQDLMPLPQLPRVPMFVCMMDEAASSRLRPSYYSSDIACSASHDTGILPNQGATQDEIDRLPCKTVEESMHHDNCCICLQVIHAGHQVRTLPCFHVFHRECIDRWLLMNDVCPLDKIKI